MSNAACSLLTKLINTNYLKSYNTKVHKHLQLYPDFQKAHAANLFPHLHVAPPAFRYELRVKSITFITPYHHHPVPFGASVTGPPSGDAASSVDRQIGRDVGQSIAFEFKNVPLHAFCCFATWKHRWSLVGILIHPGDSLNLLNQLKDLFTDFRKWHRYSSRWRSLSACLFVCYKRVFNLLKPIRKKIKRVIYNRHVSLSVIVLCLQIN